MSGSCFVRYDIVLPKRAMTTFGGTVIHQGMRAEEVWCSPWLDANEEQA